MNTDDVMRGKIGTISCSYLNVMIEACTHAIEYDGVEPLVLDGLALKLTRLPLGIETLSNYPSYLPTSGGTYESNDYRWAS